MMRTQQPTQIEQIEAKIVNIRKASGRRIQRRIMGKQPGLRELVAQREALTASARLTRAAATRFRKL